MTLNSKICFHDPTNFAVRSPNRTRNMPVGAARRAASGTTQVPPQFPRNREQISTNLLLYIVSGGSFSQMLQVSRPRLTTTRHVYRIRAYTRPLCTIAPPGSGPDCCPSLHFGRMWPRRTKIMAILQYFFSRSASQVTYYLCNTPYDISECARHDRYGGWLAVVKHLARFCPLRLQNLPGLLQDRPSLVKLRKRGIVLKLILPRL